MTNYLVTYKKLDQFHATCGYGVHWIQATDVRDAIWQAQEKVRKSEEDFASAVKFTAEAM